MFYVNVSLDELMDKYELDMLKNLNKENVNKIIEFLNEENVDYIDEIIENYLDLFLIDIEEFKMRFNLLKQKYGNTVVEQVRNDLSILDNFY